MRLAEAATVNLVQHMEDESVDLQRFLDVLRRWWWLLLLGPLVLGITALLFSRLGTPLYVTQATIFVQTQNPGSITPTHLDIEASQLLAATYRELITKRPTLEAVAASPEIPYSADQLASMVKVRAVPKTQLLEVAATSRNPEHAAQIANTVAQTFIGRVQENWLAELERLRLAAEDRGVLNNQELLDAQELALQRVNEILKNLADSMVTSEALFETQVSALTGLTDAFETLTNLTSAQGPIGAHLSTLASLSIVESAPIPDTPVDSASREFTTLFAALGLGALLSFAVVYLLEYFNDKVRSLHQIEKAFRVTTLGVVSRWRDKLLAEDGLLVAHHPHTLYAEMFRQVRANFQISVATHAGKVFMLTSPDSGTGNTTMVVNLGISLAQDGIRVVLVDGDLRHPALHQRFNFPNTTGLSSLLNNGDGLMHSVLQSSSVEGLSVLTSGPVPPNPVELLGSHSLDTIIDALRQSFDIVLFDSSPLIAIADPVVLARKVDGVVLVAVPNKTKTKGLGDGIRQIQYTGTPIVGVLLNKAPLRHRDKRYRYSSAYIVGGQGENAEVASGKGTQPWAAPDPSLAGPGDGS